MKVKKSSDAINESTEKSSNLENLKITMENLKFRNEDTGENKEIKKIHDLLDETAEDMLNIMERLNKIDSKIDSLNDQVSTIPQILEKSQRQYLIEQEKLKSEIIGEKKAFVNRSTFNALLPVFDSLTHYKNSMTGEESSVLYNHARGIIDLLNNTMLMLGYVSYSVNQGADFDPETMECLGFTEGGHHKVMVIDRKGFKAGTKVIRPCGVIIGKIEEKTNS